MVFRAVGVVTVIVCRWEFFRYTFMYINLLIMLRGLLSYQLIPICLQLFISKHILQLDFPR